MTTKCAVIPRLIILTFLAIALAIANPANADFIDQEVASVVIGAGSSSRIQQQRSWNPLLSLNFGPPAAPEAGSELSIDSVTQSEGDAGTTNFIFTVTLTPADPIDTVTVDFTTADNTATQPGDYTATSSTLTFIPNDTSETITVFVIGDTLDEANETFFVNLSNAVNATITIDQGQGTITDDDPQPTVSFTSASQNQDEGIGTMTVVAQLNTESGLAVTVPFTPTGSATNGTDYTITGSPVTIPAGSLSTNIVISVNNDDQDENNETVVVTMGTPTNGTQGSPSVHTATILDNDNQPTVSFTSASQSQGESIGSMIITAQLDAISGLDVTVPFTPTGTATNGTDYTITAPPVTILAGTLSTTITITVNEDNQDENNETVIVTMGTPTNAIQGSPSVHTATILDNDAMPTVSFTSASQSALEDVPTMTIIAQLNTISGLDVSVPFTPTGTATNGTDYTITSSPVTIPAGSLSTNILITVTNDTLSESNETVVVTMGTPNNATPGVILVHTATILDNDALPTVSFTSASQSSSEDIPTMAITAQLNVISGLAVTVPFTVTGTATGGTDYTITASPVTIPAGSLSTDITITVTNDNSDESDETVVVTIGAPTNATPGSPSVHTATIVDNDVAGATVDPTTLLTAELGDPVPFTVKLNTQPTKPVTIGISSENTKEGTVFPASLTFTPANWNLPQPVTVTPVDDHKPDGAVVYNIITAPAVSEDPNYGGLVNPPDVSVTNADNDTPGITIAPLAGLTTSEGEEADNIQIVLNTEPAGNVDITLSSSDPGEGKLINPLETTGPPLAEITITFTPTNWDTVQEVFLIGVDDLIIDNDVVYSVGVTSASPDDPDYDDLPLPDLAAINEDAPSIEWVLPVGDAGVYETDSLVPIRLRVRPISPEPISLVRFVRYDTVSEDWVTIGEDSDAPYQVYLNPADLHFEWNQINAYAFDLAQDTASIQKPIFIYRRGSVYRFYLPLILNQP